MAACGTFPDPGVQKFKVRRTFISLQGLFLRWPGRIIPWTRQSLAQQRFVTDTLHSILADCSLDIYDSFLLNNFLIPIWFHSPDPICSLSTISAPLLLHTQCTPPQFFSASSGLRRQPSWPPSSTISLPLWTSEPFLSEPLAVVMSVPLAGRAACPPVPLAALQPRDPTAIPVTDALLTDAVLLESSATVLLPAVARTAESCAASLAFPRALHAAPRPLVLSAAPELSA